MSCRPRPVAADEAALGESTQPKESVVEEGYRPLPVQVHGHGEELWEEGGDRARERRPQPARPGFPWTRLVIPAARSTSFTSANERFAMTHVQRCVRGLPARPYQSERADVNGGSPNWLGARSRTESRIETTSTGTDPDAMTSIGDAYQTSSAPLIWRKHEDIRRFFDALSLVVPGLVDVCGWGDSSALLPMLSGSPAASCASSEELTEDFPTVFEVCVMCGHQPPCPSADSRDGETARTVVAHPEQGWSLLCNGIVVFDDTGGLLPAGEVIPSHRHADGGPRTGDR